MSRNHMDKILHVFPIKKMHYLLNFKSTIAYLDTSDLYHKHGSSENMARMVAPELDARHLPLLVEVNTANTGQ